jgi:hypothetical protein
VVLLFAHKPAPTDFEAISLAQCQRVLGRYPLRLVCPAGMDVSTYTRLAPSLVPEFVDPSWMASVAAYNRMKVFPSLYRRFRKYDFLLTHELDAFVFRDELTAWCREGWDYIGAPWFEGWDKATPQSPFIGVGNSGFSLRRVATCLRISQRAQLARRVAGIWGVRRVVSRLGGAAWLRLGRKMDSPEDLFWSCEVPAVVPEFRVAPFDRARRFSLEVNASHVIATHADGLPFGCHAWKRYDPEFWRPHIEACGHAWYAAVEV